MPHTHNPPQAADALRQAIGLVQVNIDLLRPRHLLGLTCAEHEVAKLRLEEGLYADAAERLTLLSLESDLRRAISSLEALSDNDHDLITLRHRAGARAEPMPEVKA